MENFRKDVRSRQDEMREEICKGGLSYEHYKSMCGLVRGIDVVMEIYDAAMKDAMEAE